MRDIDVKAALMAHSYYRIMTEAKEERKGYSGPYMGSRYNRPTRKPTPKKPKEDKPNLVFVPNPGTKPDKANANKPGDYSKSNGWWIAT